MVLIDTIFINNGGGKVLLDYLVAKLEQTNLEIVYLIDARLRNKFTRLTSSNKVVFLDASLKQRRDYYIKNGEEFTKVFCFSNIPPPIRLQAKVYTYFHQPLFIKVPRDVSIVSRIVIFLKTLVIYKNKNYTDSWFVQSEVIKRGIIRKYKIKREVLVLPFFPSIKKDLNVERLKNHFVYVSSCAPHKNQMRLLHAFKMFYDKFKSGTLHLTIGNEYRVVMEEVANLVDKGYPVINHGFISQDELVKLYMSCEYSIFPSLTESFGLGIIEAIDNGCKLLGADRPYMTAICEPSMKFNPESTLEICNVFEQAYLKSLDSSKIFVKDRIDELINYLK